MILSLVNWLRFEISNLSLRGYALALTIVLVFATIVGKALFPAVIPFTLVVGGVLFLLVPGAFLISALGINVVSGRGLVYCILVSQIVIFVWGAIASVAHIRIGTLAPFTNDGSSWWGASLIIVIALGWHLFSGSNDQWDSSGFKLAIDVRVAVTAVVVVFLAAISAYIVNLGGTQIIWFASIMLVAMCVVIACLGQFSDANRGTLIWASGAALLFQNTIINTNLRYGDGLEEFYIANQMLLRGYWDPGFVVSRNSVLRLTVGHPFYSVLLDIPLFWEFKLIHPLTLSALPPALFVLFRRYIPEKAAALGACSYLILHPFFTTLSRNTRSGITILFFVGMVIAGFDSNLSAKKRTALAILFGGGVVISHYGLVYLFLALMISGVVGSIVLEAIGFEGDSNGNKIFIYLSLLTGVFAYIWFTNTAGSASFELISLVIYQIGVRLSGLASLSGGVASSASIPINAITYKIIKLEYFILLGLGGLGYIIVFVTRLSKSGPDGRLAQMIGNMQFSPANNTLPTLFLGLAGGALFLFILALAPTGVIGIARVLMIGLVFLLPFTALTVTIISEHLPADIANSGLSICLIIIVLVNSSVFAANLNELSTQPTFDKKDVLASGTNPEKFNLYQHYVPRSDFKATYWIYQHSQEPRVYGPGAIRAFPRPLLDIKDNEYHPQGDYRVVNKETLTNSDGYLFVSQASYELGEIVTTIRPNFVYYNESIPLEEIQTSRRNTVYSNGNTTVMR